VKKLFKTALAPVALAASVLCSTSAWAEVEYHGYFRTQGGGTSKGGNLQCFDLGWPVALDRDVGRLGNECDSFGDAQFAVGFGDQNDVWGKYHIGFAYKNKDAAAWEDTAGGNLNLANENNWFEAGGFFGAGAFEDASIWVGKRHYNRHDAHITDNYYWANNGMGSGIEGIKLGNAKTSFSYFQTGGNANAVGDVVAKRYGFRVYDIAANTNGKLESELVFINGSSADPTKTTGSGTSLMVQHTQDGVLGGFNKLALILGNDAGAGFGWQPTYAGGDNGSKGNKSWMLSDQLNFAIKDTKWSGMVAGVVGQIDASWGKPSFTSVVVRPQYNFTKNTSVAFELGHARGKNGGSSPSMTKFTIAPQLTLTEGFWARPVLRAFVTHAKWNNDAGTVANGVFGTATSGTSYGFQAEAWW
jgi:maltoporin